MSVIRQITVLTALTSVGLIAYLCFWPIAADPVAWVVLPEPGYSGAFASNTRLGHLQMIDTGTEAGPEHIAPGPDGKLYAAMESGNVLRMNLNGEDQKVFANTRGRILGFAFDAKGQMIVADAMRGLLRVAPDGAVTPLADHVTVDDPIGYANSVIVAPDGIIYFTDSSRRFSPWNWGGTYQASVLDIMEQSATGRVLAYDPATGKVRIVAHGLSFANGIALSADGRSLFVCETGRYRIWKIETQAQDQDVSHPSPFARILVDNLPGYPDNIMRGREGRMWVGLFKPRNPAADRLAQKPFFRAVMLRLPRAFLPLGKPYGHVFAINEEGRVTEDLQDPTGAYPQTTGVLETADRLYIHSLNAPALGWLPREKTTQIDGGR